MKTDIKEELMAIAPPLAGIGNANCYRAPEHYFDGLSEEIMSKIQLPFTELPYAAPAPDYFAGLADSILGKLKSNGTIVEAEDEVSSELSALSPLVAGIKKVNVYTVPADYFFNFKVAVPAVAPVAKVIALKQPVRWTQYAAAAVVVGLVAIGGLLWFNNHQDAGNINPYIFTTDYTSSLSSVSDDAIANYLKQSPAQMDLTLPEGGYDENKISADDLTKQLLNDVSDADIQKYIQENQTISEKDIKGI